jgi:hypothetical protein
LPECRREKTAIAVTGKYFFISAPRLSISQVSDIFLDHQPITASKFTENITLNTVPEVLFRQAQESHSPTASQTLPQILR